MINAFQAFILGTLQGITELFPISSLGHSVILPRLLGWNINQKDSFFLIFLVATHLATSLVLFAFFFKDWMRIITGIFRSLIKREISINDSDAKLGWLLIVGTIPAGILGLLFEEYFKKIFAAPQLVAFFLIGNGILLYVGEVLRSKRQKVTHVIKEDDTRIARQLSWSQAIGVGTMQAIALFPGFSRTGSSLVGGLVVGLSHEDAARYSFLLATPIIAAAAVLKLPELAIINYQSVLAPLTIGVISSAIFAYLSVIILMKYFETHNLKLFSIYCLIIGVISSLIFLFH